MKTLGIFAIGMRLGLIFGAAISGDVHNSTTYMVDRDCLEHEVDTEVTINGDE